LRSLASLGPILAYSDHLGEAFYAVDRDWRLVAINETALAFAGMRREDMVGRCYWDLVPHREGSENEALLRAAMAADRPMPIVAASRLHTDRLLSGVAVPLQDGLAISFRDITDERATEVAREQRLRESENRLRLALEAAELGTWDFNPLTGEVAWDERSRRLFGFAPDVPVTYEDYARALHPEDRETVLTCVAAALDPGGSGEIVTEHRVVDQTTGEERWLSGRGRAFFEDGRPVRLIGTVRDVTARRQNRAALRESESRLRLALDAGRMAVWAFNPLTQKLTSSPELNRMLGFPLDHALTIEESRSRYYPGEVERLRAAAEAALAGGERHIEVEFRVVLPETGLRWLLLRAEVVLSAAGVPGDIIGVLLDITDRKAAEDALREREAELRAAMSAADLATFDFDHLTGTMTPSPRLNEIYGYAPDEVLRIDRIRARYHPEDIENIHRSLASAAQSGQGQFELEFRLLLPGRAVRWVNGRGEFVRDATGRVLRSRGVVQDVTERKRWEERQQLLINELNHRVKNTLATVQSIASQSLRSAESAEEARHNIEDRLIALSRAHDVLTREGWAGANVREIASRAVEPYETRPGERVRLAGPDVRLNPQGALAIAMALQELATNAVKYGALSTSAGRVDLTWGVERSASGQWVHVQWLESGGPPVRVPTRRGFGTRLIERSLAADLGGQVGLEFRPEGVACNIHAPLPAG
jgi:PAS domain S-box-containing protein